MAFWRGISDGLPFVCPFHVIALAFHGLDEALFTLAGFPGLVYFAHQFKFPTLTFDGDLVLVHAQGLPGVCSSFVITCKPSRSQISLLSSLISMSSLILWRYFAPVSKLTLLTLSLIHISEPTRLGM